MKSFVSQRGVGLIEVLVAVLLLSIAVLGFSALQVRAVSATDESLIRTQSLTIIRNLAEIMRAYPEAYVIGSGTTFTSAISTATKEQPAEEEGGVPTILTAQPTIQAIVSSTAIDSVTVDDDVISMNGANNCLAVSVESCNINQLATREALTIKKMAADQDIKLAVATCPGTTTQAIQTQMCIITAWNDTKALLDDSDVAACADSNGVYKTGSHCLISEAY